ncbi:membrane protein [Rhizocola hellebori]|uniref:Membrane protein n=1 Tax=Rhizocola hellebori TaxID=1392758 RepID=A0A8J3VFM2_9ACTN|nr:zf-HC2 domain-containing protein [Rhizocola hellebori]GIH05484.1 membrane protein [Rhizocola hellebori]
MNPSDHLSATALHHYVAGDVAVAADVLWAIEAHLENCAPCRARLGDTVIRQSPKTVSLLARVETDLAVSLARSPQMPVARRHRRVGRWAPPGLWPRLAMTVLVVAAALGLDLAGGARVWPSLVLLVAPVAPLLGVAALWSAGLDPAHELVVASPRAGLYMVLRRTLAVLVVIVPALAVAGWLTGASPAAWLLPCLAFTAGALALGELIGLRWAAAALGLAWTAAVITPSLLTLRVPLLLQPVSLPYWAALIAMIAVALVVRRDAYTGLRSTPWFVR